MNESDCNHADLEKREEAFICRGCGIELPRPAKDREQRFQALREQLKGKGK